ncbi:MAG TPA: peptidylprolyl isomerase [Candidatus Coprenecus stercorigallinarum]|nr:peptidylprolyl isomerase [Candidatus Coprenecus stercorigallinarum]
MKIKVVLAVAAVLVTAAWSLRAQKYDGLIDKTVALVGNSMIQLSQVEGEVQMMQFQGYVSDRNLRCEVLENMMVSKLFYTQAQLDSLSVNPDMVDASLNERVNNILSQLGGEEEVEKYFGKPLHRLRQEWREAFVEQNLAQEMQQEVAGKITEVTPKDVEQFYRRVPKDSLPVIPTQYQYSQIVLYPNTERAKLAVRERLLEFRQRILDGEKFSLLATLYSEDPGSAMRGGELGMASKSIFWPAFSDAAMSLKEGQVSPIVETPDGFHLIQLIKKDGDMFNARHILIKPKYTIEDRDSAFIRLDSIRTVVAADSITFQQAARMFSEDPKSRTNGGLVADPMSGAPFFEVDRLKPADYNVLKNMKEGEISEPFESVDDEGRSGNTIYKIIRLEKIRPSHQATVEEDFNVLLDIATNQKRIKAIEDFIKDKQETTYIVIDPMFQNCDFRRDGWIK